MEGRICLVTGANRGLGYATALELARRGATLLLLCRDPERAERARDEMRRTTGNDAIEIVLCDLGSLASVRDTAAAILRRHAALHVLVNNAGVNLPDRAVNEAGVSLTFAVNHLGPFLLTNLLLPQLRAGAPARIINVTSKLERFGRLHPSTLEEGSGAFFGLRAYVESKQANVLFTYELAERLAADRVTVNCVHPGLVATDLMRHWPHWMRRSWEWALRSAASGAESIVRLATAPELASVTGRYFDRRRTSTSSRRSYDVRLRREVWAVSERLTGLGE